MNIKQYSLEGIGLLAKSDITHPYFCSAGEYNILIPDLNVG